MCDMCREGITLADVLKTVDREIVREKLVSGIVKTMGVDSHASFSVWMDALNRAGFLPLLAYNPVQNVVMMGFTNAEGAEGIDSDVLRIAEIPLDNLIIEVERYKEMRKRYTETGDADSKL